MYQLYVINTARLNNGRLVYAMGGRHWNTARAELITGKNWPHLVPVRSYRRLPPVFQPILVNVLSSPSPLLRFHLVRADEEEEENGGEGCRR